jgi:dTDP-6-deoxy-L-talose 4-dehydrogenase [NAD(P)+]
MTEPCAVVLGGTGFVGRHVVDVLAGNGYRVVSVARGITRRPGVVSIRLDLAAASVGQLAEVLATVRPSVVVNAAGAVWGGVSEQEMVETNVRLVRRLVTAMARLPEPARLVQLGTVHEYGPIPYGARITEDMPTRPAAVYGRTKALGTAAALAGGADAVVLRVGNVAGAGTPGASLLGQVAAKLAAGRRDGKPVSLELFRLDARRDFVDVRDVAEAVLAAASAEVGGRVINIGSGDSVRVRELVRGLVAVSGVAADIVERDADRTETGARGMDTDWQEIDISAARELLDWKPRFGVEDSVRAVWAAASRA